MKSSGSPTEGQALEKKRRKKTAKARHISKHRAPIEVAKLIERVNQLPHDVWEWSTFLLRNLSGADYHRKMKEAIDALPYRLRQYVGDYPLNDDTVAQLAARERYDILIAGRDLLRAMDKSDWNPEEPDALWRIKLGALKSVLSLLGLKANKKGRPEIEIPQMLQPLFDCDIYRIRECGICKRIFWAERKDQPACTERCNNIRHTRIQRGQYDKSNEKHLRIRSQMAERKR